MRFGGTFIAVLLVLGACSSEAKPREPAPSATSTTSLATPTAAAPTMPAQAGEDSPEGAAAFVKHYIDVFNYAARSGDVDELSRLSSPDCKGCQSYIKLYRETYANGGYFKGGDWTLGDLKIEDTPPIRRVMGHVNAPPGSQRPDGSTSEGPTTAEDSDLVFLVDFNGGNHLIRRLTRATK